MAGGADVPRYHSSRITAPLRPADSGCVGDASKVRIFDGIAQTLSVGSVRENATFEFEVGVVPQHEFDFHRADVRVHSTGVPVYGGFSFKAEF
jgi:hypothetical protein